VTDRSPAGRGRRQPKAVHTVLIAASLVMATPFLWQVVTSLQSLGDATRVPADLLPRGQWSNYRQVFGMLPFGRQFLNTVIVAVARAAGQVLFCSMAAYAFARFRFPGRKVLFALVLSVLMVPPQLLIVPQYQLMASLGWLDSLRALVAPGLFSAFGVFMVRQFLLGLPREMEEAARIDGAGPVRVFWSIVLPLARPVLIALGLLTLVWSWNDLLWPLVVNTDPDRMTLSAGLISLQGQFQTDYPVLMAGSLLASLPVIGVFLLAQRRFVHGVAQAATGT
jgi:multiple sugar transport system permease protein